MNLRANLEVTTLLTNEGSSRCGIHHDPPAPLPALIAGPTCWRLTGDCVTASSTTSLPLSADGISVSPPSSPHRCPPPSIIHSCHDLQWVRKQRGGRLFLFDGLFDLSYGPRDVLMLDGRFAHGVTCLRDLPGANAKGSRAELQRLSLIMFSTWKRDKMKGEKRLRSGFYATWQDEWRLAVPWKHYLPCVDRFASTVLSGPRERKPLQRYGCN